MQPPKLKKQGGKKRRDFGPKTVTANIFRHPIRNVPESVSRSLRASSPHIHMKEARLWKKDSGQDPGQMKAKDRTKAILTRKGTGNNSGWLRGPKKRGKTPFTLA